MLNGFTGLLLLQLAGEGIARALALPVPGPIIGFVLLLAVLRMRPNWTASLKVAADGLLSHLSLLFIPAGVGVVMHLKAIREEGLAIAVALAVSTLVGLAVTAWVAERLGKREAVPEHEAARDA
jgi:holin-like protein